ncbi:HTTM domain-containing protein [Halocola ammonii]
MSWKGKLFDKLDAIGESNYKPIATWIFSRLVYLWMIAFWLYHWNDFQIMYGEDALITTNSGRPGFIVNKAYFLSYHPGWAQAILWVHLVACVLSMWERISYFPRIVVYLTMMMFYFGAHYSVNAGFLVIMLFSAYLIVVNLRYRNRILVMLSNFGVWACMVQVCLIYFIAALAKWRGDQWLDGTAMYYSLSLDMYGDHPIAEFLLQYPAITAAMTYLGLAYQTLVPIFIWIKPTKRVFLLMGLGFHLFIAVVMSLYFFSAAMTLGYILFARRDTLRAFAERIPRFAQGIRLLQ